MSNFLKGYIDFFGNTHDFQHKVCIIFYNFAIDLPMAIQENTNTKL